MLTIFTMGRIKSLTDIRAVKIQKQIISFKIGIFSGTSTLLGAPHSLLNTCNVGVTVPIRDEETEAHWD